MSRGYNESTKRSRAKTAMGRTDHRAECNTWAGQLEGGVYSNVCYTPVNDKYMDAAVTQTDMEGIELPPIGVDSTEMDDFPPVGANYQMPENSQSPRPRSETARGRNPSHNDYYQRMAKSSDVYSQLRRPRFNPGPPTFRSGRLGAPWRHIRQCTGNLGNHICFVDGVIKQDDMNRYPPFGYVQPPPQEFLHLPPPFLSANKKQALGVRATMHHNPFQKHAKEGFKYWQDEKMPMAEQALPKRTIQGRLMRLGIGH